MAGMKRWKGLVAASPESYRAWGVGDRLVIHHIAANQNRCRLTRNRPFPRTTRPRFAWGIRCPHTPDRSGR